MSAQRGGDKKPCFVRRSRCPKWEYDDDDDDDDTRLWPEKKKRRRVGLPRYHRDLIATINNAAASIKWRKKRRAREVLPFDTTYLLQQGGPEWEGVLCRR